MKLIDLQSNQIKALVRKCFFHNNVAKLIALMFTETKILFFRPPKLNQAFTFV